jgi:hypothetical protein
MAEPRPAILGPLGPLLISTDQRTDDRLAPGGCAGSVQPRSSGPTISHWGVAI